MATSVAAPPDVVTPGRQRAAYTEVAVVGLLLAAAAPAVALTAALLAGMAVGEEGLFFGVMIAAPLLGAALVWRFGLWAKVLGAVLSIAVAFMLFWMAFGLAYPASFADFVPGALLPLGAVLGLGGSIAAIVQHRRGHLGTSATRGERRVLLGALGIAGLVVVASAVASMLGGTTAGATEGAIPVTMSDFTFAEETYEVAAGEPTTMLVQNSDAFVHTFTIPALGIDETVLPGDEVAVTLDAPAGTYTLYCTPHSNTAEEDPAEAGMAATVIAR